MQEPLVIFIGYPEKSKRYKFFCPNYSTRIIKSSIV